MLVDMNSSALLPLGRQYNAGYTKQTKAAAMSLNGSSAAAGLPDWSAGCSVCMGSSSVDSMDAATQRHCKLACGFWSASERAAMRGRRLAGV